MGQENNIEFIKNGKTATAFFTQGKYISKLKKLAKERPEECQIVINTDGSLLAHFPVKWVKVSPPRTISEEQRLAAAERLKMAHGLK